MDTERAIGTKLIAAGDARTAVLRRVFPASPETVWQAITDRAHLSGWFIEPRGDLRLGGTFEGLTRRACQPARRAACVSR